MGTQSTRSLVTRGGGAIRGREEGPQFIDSAVNTVAGEVGLDQLEPHELSRLRADREKQLDIRNFTLNFGPQHPVCLSLQTSLQQTTEMLFMLLTDSLKITGVSFSFTTWVMLPNS